MKYLYLRTPVLKPLNSMGKERKKQRQSKLLSCFQFHLDQVILLLSYFGTTCYLCLHLQAKLPLKKIDKHVMCTAAKQVCQFWH